MIKRLYFIIALMCMVSVASARRISETAALENEAEASETLIPGRHCTKTVVTLAYKSDNYHACNYAGGG